MLVVCRLLCRESQTLCHSLADTVVALLVCSSMDESFFVQMSRPPLPTSLFLGLGMLWMSSPSLFPMCDMPKCYGLYFCILRMECGRLFDISPSSSKTLDYVPTSGIGHNIFLFLLEAVGLVPLSPHS